MTKEQSAAVKDVPPVTDRDRLVAIEKRLAAIEQWKSEFRTLSEMGVDVTFRM